MATTMLTAVWLLGLLLAPDACSSLRRKLPSMVQV
jgi:hypothetical protein